MAGIRFLRGLARLRIAVAGLVDGSKPGFVVKAEEPLVSYKQVLLSQINHCAKAPRELFSLCVDNLISLLPLELRAEVLREYEEVKELLVKYIVEEVNRCRVEDGVLICELFPVDVYMACGKVVSKVKAEKPDLYLKHGHILGELVYQHLKKLVPQQIAHRWAFYKIPSVIKLESSSSTRPESNSTRGE